MGCDSGSLAENEQDERFNPRTRMGCDNATGSASTALSCFNPRTRMGCDQVGLEYDLFTKVSIHAPAWGATLAIILSMVLLFVSIHAPAWGATLSLARFDAYALFQSTHPHGVRQEPDPKTPQARRFNPRTRMGCDVYAVCIIIV